MQETNHENDRAISVHSVFVIKRGLSVLSIVKLFSANVVAKEVA